MLKETYFKLLSEYTENDSLCRDLWTEVESSYSLPERHYHNLSHLEHLLKVLLAVKEHITDWNTVLFSMYYHDIIYSVTAADNEENSAVFAERCMNKLQVPHAGIIKCKEQILATKTHIVSVDADTNYFTDADLSILGQSGEDYLNYSTNVRNEYAVYPDSVYDPGRKKVLNHFLTMNRIFKTDLFYNKFELQARRNIQAEIERL